MDSKKYNNTKLFIGVFKGVLGFIAIFLFISMGYSKLLFNETTNLTNNSYLQLLIFVFFAGIINSIIFLPFSFYSGYYLEHKYKLSNQNFFKWVLENLKGILIGSVIGIPILFVFYWTIVTYSSFWWVPFAVVLFLFSVVLAQILPVVILPLFYKITPISSESLRNRVSNLAKNVKMEINDVYSFNMSKNTKKANAAFAGLGRTKRVILGDTLVENFSDDEIETVLAHEFGHYKYKHISKNIVISTVNSFILLFLISVLYEMSLGWFGFVSISEIAAFPIVLLWSMLISIFQTPFNNYLSRKFEYQADEYAVRSTSKKDDFVNTLIKINKQNLGDSEPHPFVEWFFYSHPSINKRIDYINKLNL